MIWDRYKIYRMEFAIFGFGVILTTLLFVENVIPKSNFSRKRI